MCFYYPKKNRSDKLFNMYLYELNELHKLGGDVINYYQRDTHFTLWL